MPMELIADTTLQPSSLPTRGGAWRLRPGEAPSWADLPLDRSTATTWRLRAGQTGLGVNAWLAALLEYELVQSNLAELGVDLQAIVGKARQALEVDRLAPTAGLRQWVAQLTDPGSQGDLPSDELPSIVMPERLLAQLAPSAVPAILNAAAESEAETEATVMERAAAAVGLTMDAWAYLMALRLQNAASV